MVILIVIKRPHKEAHKLWKHLLYLKLALTVLLLRSLSEVVVGLFSIITPQAVLKFQLLIVLSILMISVYTRFYREDVTKFFSVTAGNSEFHKFGEEEGGQRDIQMQRFD
ncbi:hypothetical protein FGO68_gene4441 [Halteria grandinella]|uniref:Uncharacterized protein n=1 Tax=Halteria grandinella TaxID=5974 RepID=A0A8J8P3S6_HALGN|nr:hypothetical protein FGO68_gene4441 [Halteria grandinella]